MEIRICSAKAPVNIAVIKYWGKRDEALVLPINDSISVTLSMEEMCATTTVACSPAFKTDRLWLNGKEQDASNPRLINCIQEVKIRAMKNGGGQPFLQWHVHICSENNFPTAAGLASSAAGYACLVFALSSLYGVHEDLTTIARLGSGSACRSIYGGFVQWEKGCAENGSDSVAKPIASQDHWPELRVLILVVNAEKKKTGSTIGMKESVQTSELLKYRASEIVPRKVKEISSAILKKDFHKFGKLAMQDSNQFHAICLDTYPPIHYMDSTSFAIIELVHAYNAFYEEIKVAYTFDAGPNACLFLPNDDVPEVMSIIKHFFPSLPCRSDYVRGLPVSEVVAPKEICLGINLSIKPGALQFILHTKVGSGPEIIQTPSEHLLDERGLPKWF